MIASDGPNRRIGQRALGGAAALEGDRLVRLVYLDEGGVSRREPLVVVSGVIVDAAKSLIAIEDYLDGLVEKYIPKEDRNGFVFDATELWSDTR